MSESRSESYKAAGVDVTAGYEAVKLMKPMVESTYVKGVMGTLGGFGGLFRPEFKGMADPILVSGTDGVGTKLKLAFLMDNGASVPFARREKKKLEGLYSAYLFQREREDALL